MKKSIVLVLGFALLTGCGGSKGTTQHENPPGWEVGGVEVGSDVVVVPDDMEVVVTAAALVFSAADAAALGNVTESTILVSGKGVGFLRRVTSISEGGDDVLFGTVNASLAELLVSANIQGSIPVEFADTAPSQKDAGFGVDYSGTVLYENSGLTLSLSHAGITFTPSIDFDIDLDGAGIEYFKVAMVGQFEASLAAELHADYGGSYNGEINLWESQPITTTVWAGWVPIVIVTYLSLDAGFGLSIDADLTAEAGGSLTSTLTLGAEYANGSWSPIAEDDFQVQPIGPTLDINAGASLRVFLRPKVECRLYDVAGPVLTVEPYGRLSASLLPPPPGWELGAGVLSDLGMRVEMFDKELFDWSTTLFDKYWPLASGGFVGCADQDGDNRDGYHAQSCPEGTDYCDDDPNNWTEAGCANCVDGDGDSYGSGCDKGEDCDDADDTIHTGCAACGNGLIEAGEQCDDGNTAAGDGCSDTCQLEVAPGCGNGVRELGEACDDGNTTACDGCSAGCTVEACGNGVQECAEACDDGNGVAGDGCSPTCAVEASGVCGDGVVHPTEACDDGNAIDGDGCSAACTVETAGVCGDGILHPAEGCDDGNNTACDGCSAGCAVEACGNGVPECSETCDDGNNTPGDGCAPGCSLEVAPGCGNGVLEQGEECDDGNTTAGDGCSATCQDEAPNLCGNSTLDAGEDCDDGNQINGDGCTAQCQTEVPGFCIGDYVLSCGDFHAHNNGGPGSTQHINNYGCTGMSETGPEYAYVFTATVSGQATVSIDPLTADLDVFVLDGSGAACDTANTCVSYGDTEVSWSTTAGTTYYIVVDGYQGAVSDYELTLTCGVCGDGVVDPGEECDDGNTSDGDGCSAGCIYETAGACSPATTIQCGDTVSGNNGGSGSTDNIDSYGCGGWVEDGPEYAYTFTASTNQTVTVTRTYASAQLDIYVLEDLGGGCLANDCYDYHDISVSFSATAGETYYIVMDGYQGAVGDYTIQLTCN